MIDFYCEHSGGAITQPLNVISNAAFFVAGFFAWKLMRRENVQSMALYSLLALLLCIGVGSTLYHGSENEVTQLADVLPILFFQLVYIPAFGVKAMKLKAWGGALLFALYIALLYLAELAPETWLNGSMGYLPALVFIGGFGAWQWFTQKQTTLLQAAGLFVVSLLLRTFDMALCFTIPIGTHFLWHALNGAVLYLALAGFIKSAKRV